jgi:hypothetical protein
MHGPGGGALAPVVQQKCVELPPAVPTVLQLSEVSILSGVFEPAHVKPYESPLHAGTV